MPRGPVLIRGAGLSGSLLALALAEADPRRPVLLTDISPTPNSGRGWALFQPHDAARGAASGVVRETPVRVLRVVARGRWLDRPLAEHTYGVIDGAVLDHAVDEALHRVGGERLLSPDEGSGAPPGLDAPACVVDATGPRDGEPAHARMQFVGVRVRTAAPRFDPGVLTFMDFDVEPQGDLRFGHVLATSPTEALVDLTAVTAPDARAVGLDTGLDSYVEQVAGARAQVVGREQGQLPLVTARSSRRTADGIRIGARAGLIRASTGYGARAMQRDAHALALQIAAGTDARGIEAPRRYRFLDRVFLDVARRDPDALVDALLRMFVRVPTDRVIRFLDGESTLPEEASIVAAMPPAPFLRALAARRPAPGD